MILGVKEHEMHHRGQLMVMERMVGVVPHLTRVPGAHGGKEVNPRQRPPDCSESRESAQSRRQRSDAMKIRSIPFG